MDEPVSIKPFIREVPEETIPTRKLTDEPVRTHLLMNENIYGATDEKTLFVVPKDSVFEIRSINLSAVSSVATLNEFSIIIIRETAPQQGLFSILLGNICCANFINSYAPASLLVPAGSTVLITKSSTHASSSFNVVISGNFIKKDEVSKKLNVII